MNKNCLVTITQALALRGLGFDEVCLHYVMYDEQTQAYTKTPRRCMVIDAKKLNNLLPIPTVDEALDFIRRTYNVHAYGIEPTVDFMTHRVMYSFKVKYCNTLWGWNQREYIGCSQRTSNCNAAKRSAITMAIRYIKKKQKQFEDVKNKSRNRTTNRL